jgi:hypothetical protein
MALHSLTSNHLLFTASIARMPSTAKAWHHSSSLFVLKWI